jgi:hypothetical protein
MRKDARSNNPTGKRKLSDEAARRLIARARPFRGQRSGQIERLAREAGISPCTLSHMLHGQTYREFQ